MVRCRICEREFEWQKRLNVSSLALLQRSPALEGRCKRIEIGIDGWILTLLSGYRLCYYFGTLLMRSIASCILGTSTVKAILKYPSPFSPKTDPYPICWTHKSEIKYSCGWRNKWQRHKKVLTFQGGHVKFGAIWQRSPEYRAEGFIGAYCLWRRLPEKFVARRIHGEKERYISPVSCADA
jgi:hypothetical protein